jgi:2-octaprenylphenol hydroxylase
MEVWDENSEGKLVFHSASLGQEFLGYIIENREMVKALWENLKTFPEVSFFCPSQWESLERFSSGFSSGYWQVGLQGGLSITANLLVGADGAKSKVREFLGISAKPVPYGQQAIVVNVSAEKPHKETAYQRFLTQGPVAFLPLKANLEQGLGSVGSIGSIVWSVSTSEAESLMALSPEEFERALTQALGERLGKLNLISERASFPLRHHHAACYIGEGNKAGAMLIGDAAHGIHPLAGLGVNLGFHDVKIFKAVLAEAALKNRPLLTQSNLKKYERQAWAYNETIRQSMTMINTVFSRDSAGSSLTKIRGVGMNLINRFDIVKSLFSRAAQG